MTSLVAQFAQRRLIFAAVLIAVLAVLFWTQSRYPQLDEKAMMSGAIQLEDPISFDVVFPVDPTMPVLERIGKTTVNWLDTNKKGMTFGVLIAAAFLSLFGYLQKRNFRGGLSNSMLGLAMGAPLGVCVNCAAPIARGLYAGGVRAETTLSATALSGKRLARNSGMVSALPRASVCSRRRGATTIQLATAPINSPMPIQASTSPLT